MLAALSATAQLRVTTPPRVEARVNAAPTVQQSLGRPRQGAVAFRQGTQADFAECLKTSVEDAEGDARQQKRRNRGVGTWAF